MLYAHTHIAPLKLDFVLLSGGSHAAFEKGSLHKLNKLDVQYFSVFDGITLAQEVELQRDDQASFTIAIGLAVRLALETK